METSAPATPAVSAPPDRAEAEACLRDLAGPAAVLRDDQWRAIEALVAGRRALVVQRTGWGKSAVYFVATHLLRRLGHGPTLIVSPLLALMRNQVAAAAKAGIRAREINSTNAEAWQEVYDEIDQGLVDVLLVSPERLNNPAFRDRALPELARTVGLLVVDEAHCISDWGHDFRPDYRRLRTLIDELPAHTAVLATTATANDRVTADVAEQLGTGSGSDTLVLRGSLDRESLHLAVVRLPTDKRLAWLADHLGRTPSSGIVYTLTKAAADDVAEFLGGRGHAVASYHGGVGDAERRQAEDDLLGNRVKALVATSALGMGFDKPDLGFVIHLGAPASPIAYYQQVGRAGRGVDRADVVLLPGVEDRDIWAYFDSVGFPREEVVTATLTALAEAGKPRSVTALEAEVDLNRGRLEAMLKVLDVEGAVRRVQGGWISTGQPWTYDRERYERVAQVRRREQQAMLDYATSATCRMEFLRRQLDDPAAAPCGRCDICTGTSPSTETSAGAQDAARRQLARTGVPLPTRKQWPPSVRSMGVPLSGNIAAADAAESGRALARLSDVGWGTRLRALLGDSAPDVPLPPDVLRAVTGVLADWDWAARPVGVVAVASRRRPELVRSLAEGLAGLGRLPLLGTVERVDADERAGGSNSAQRLRAVWDRFAVPPALAEGLARAPGPVLLVDDRFATGWTMTVAALLLRRAGAPGVLPFALAHDTA